MPNNLRAVFRDTQKYSDVLFMLQAMHIADDYSKFCKTQVLSRLDGVDKLTFNEIRVLLLVVKNGNCVTPCIIVEQLRQDPATVTRTAQKLAKFGLVEIKSNSSDKRSIDIIATEKGLEICRQYRSVYFQAFEAIETKYDLGLDEAEKTQILDAMELLISRTHILARERGLLSLEPTSGACVAASLPRPKQARP